MTNRALIRSVEPSDFDQWRRLWDGYNAFYERVGPTAVPDEVTRMTWGRFFDSYDPVNALVADDGGQLLGLAHYIFHRSTTMLGPTCYLQDLFTANGSRGTGIGSALINGVYDRARAAGAKRVYWHTHTTNTVAQSLYDKVAEASGFIVYRKDL